MNPDAAALILIGFQNDYFADDGILNAFLEDRDCARDTRNNTVSLVARLVDSPVSIIATPILFTPDYSELVDPIGILKSIKEVGAFREGADGGLMIPQLRQFGERITIVPGKRGLNAFSNTDLEAVLVDRGVKHVIVAGVVTSICVDSTARSAFERGFSVSILSDCTAGRTSLEQDFYVREIFPLYARVVRSNTVLSQLSLSKW